MDRAEFDRRVEAIKKNPLKNKDDLSFGEKHAIRHIRNLRDKEYTRIAWKSCAEYSEIYMKCHDEERYLAPFKCQGVLDDLKICINKKMIELRTNSDEITSVPVVIPDFVDWTDKEGLDKLKKDMIKDDVTQ